MDTSDESNTNTPPGDDYDCLYRLVLCGDSGVGKSCLMLRFAGETYTDDHNVTMGIDFRSRTVERDGRRVKLQLWDTAGEERFRSIVRGYYRGAQGVIIVYDVTDPASFDNVATWLQETTSYCTDGVHRLLVGNKSDVTDNRAVSFDTAKEFADKVGMPYLETSAKNDTHVEEAFLGLTQTLIKHHPEQPGPTS